MSRASVTAIPLNPNSDFNKPLIALADNEVGLFSPLSMAGTERCATMTDSIPASIKALNGAISILSKASLDLFTTGISTCESTLTSPCPGKCLAVAITPLSCIPFM